MSSKADLQRKLKEIGYEIGPFASKDTLSNVIRLHSLALQNTGIDVSNLSDLSLRKNLTENGHAVGPVTNHTRAIYQRKLLEVLTNEASEGQEDETEMDVPTSTTPTRATRHSTVRSEDPDKTSSPVRPVSNEPRIPLTRVDIDDKNTNNLASYYPNLPSTKPKSDQTITNSYSPQRSSTKPESRNSNISYGLRDPYNFQDDEPVVIRHEHKATPFRTANAASSETFSTSTGRYIKPSEVQAPTRNTFSSGNDISEIRARIFGNTNEQKDHSINKDSTPKKVPSVDDSVEAKKPANNEKLAVANKGNGTFLYGGITVAVALIVFVIYFLLE